ncbi:MAG TPA: hypothetical protein VJY12_10610 [Dysgonamonadaceae bacterium]|nr:hypothetical protein [Dysgonamonadaceae bacterium]
MVLKHDVVETSKMSMEYDGSLIDTERNAATDLDNGRLAVRDGATYKYPAAKTATELFLITTPEKTYTNVGLNEFYNKEGKKVRAVRVMLGDQFGTTAATGDVGDILMVDTQGKLIANDAGTVEFEVVAKRMVSGYPGLVVERIK